MKVVVEQAVDEATYVTDGVAYERGPEESGFQVFVRFVAKNGYDRGKVHRVPIQRVVMVVEDGHDG